MAKVEWSGEELIDVEKPWRLYGKELDIIGLRESSWEVKVTDMYDSGLPEVHLGLGLTKLSYLQE